MTFTVPQPIAYIDPGSGALLLQFILAGLVGGVVYFRNQVVGLASWLKDRAFARKN
ncbi:MAG: hypothetical protein PVI86_19185 [Phycisphaerae bacterium]